MIEKIGPIKNPLTVIAIFAGLAEVSGTVVLPLLDREIQQTYVWFLMAFPTLLVVLFFATLLLKREALYAPSDFRSDEPFTALVTVTGVDDNTALLRTFWMPDGHRINSVNEGRLLEEMKQTNVTDGVSISLFLNAAKYGDARATAVKNLNLKD